MRCTLGAHQSAIYGLDWSPQSEREFLTCSADCDVMIWDTDLKTSTRNTCSRVAQLTATVPIGRARFTPFGSGVVTAAWPHAARRAVGSTLLLWSLSESALPVYDFKGYSEDIRCVFAAFRTHRRVRRSG